MWQNNEFIETSWFHQGQTVASAADDTLPASAGHALPAPVFSEIGPVNLLETILRVWAQYREFHALYAKLARLSDRGLRDMGIARADIARLAYAEAERRVATSAPNRAETSTPAWHDPAPAR